jgi:hypothetical protein
MRTIADRGFAALVAQAQAAAERSIAAIDDALEYIVASEHRIAQLEAQRACGNDRLRRGTKLGFTP